VQPGRMAAIRIGALEVRPSTLEAVWPDGRETLQPRVMQVLVVLACAAGEVVQRGELIAECWGGQAVTDDSVNLVIAKLRKLAARTSDAFAIETIARVGYRLVEAEEDPHRAATGKPRRSDARSRWIRAATVVLALLCLAAGGLWIFRGRLRPAEPSADIRVAVLPFDTVGQDPAARRLGDALPAKIIEALSQDEVLTISRADGAALRGAGADAQAARLGVGLTVDGVVESDGKSLKVDVHLEDPRAHVTLWSKAFDGTAQDPGTLEDRVAARATAVTKWALSPRLRAVWKDRALVANYLEAQDESEHENGGRYLEIARNLVARAPGFAAGHTLLGYALIGSARPTSEEPSIGVDQAVAESAKQAQIAMSLDPKDGGPYALLNNDLPLSAWRERERWLLKGLSIDPDNAGLACTYAWYLLANVGRNQAAVDWLRSSVRTYPYIGNCTEVLAVELAYTGRADEAAAMIATTRRRWDVWDAPAADLAIAIATHRYERAIALFDDPAYIRVLGSPPASAIEKSRAFVRILAAADPAWMRAEARAVAGAVESGVVSHGEAVWDLAALGDVDGAFREADRAFTTPTIGQAAGLEFGTEGGVTSLFTPGTAAMRRDPRFMALAARIGLVDYWRATGHWPDFCAEPGLPYDCKAEAARLAAAH
jgi:DNA-binding winged helix-turn-helix (wHTH) protein/TolB-like protein